MESKDNTASPYLPVLEIQPAQTGQVGLSCLLQQPGNSLGLASPAVEDWLVPGHGRDLGHGGCSVGPLQGQGPAPTARLGWASAGPRVLLLGEINRSQHPLGERPHRQ